MGAPANPWDLGDYPELARRLEPAAASVVEVAGSGRGRSALDVAAGTGNVALRLAGAEWRTAATDFSEQMVAKGRLRAQRVAQQVDWRVADVASQPFPDSSFDLVTSSFGLIFSQDPTAALSEMARVLASGGRLVFTTWPNDGYMAHMTSTMAPFLPQATSGPEPFRWGSETFLVDALAGSFGDIDIERRALSWTFDSADAGRRWLERVSPGHIAAMAAAGERAEVMMDAVQGHLESYGDPTGRVSVEAEYLLVTALLTAQRH